MFNIFRVSDVIKVGDWSVLIKLFVLLCRKGDYFLIVA
jgi:hypothetical protein